MLNKIIYILLVLAVFCFLYLAVGGSNKAEAPVITESNTANVNEELPVDSNVEEDEETDSLSPQIEEEDIEVMGNDYGMEYPKPLDL
ncbi:hypothetical protein KC723_02285 [Candidatus Kaiserbacteria bacterium]|nr:hypothetical protein [Candidatus Kaiserbacteria bacterium]